MDSFLIIKIVLGFICFYIYDTYLFAKIQERYCKNNKGNCKTCNCWSCPRFQFLDKNGELKLYENQENFLNKIKKIFFRRGV